MTEKSTAGSRRLQKELLLFLGLFGTGLLLLPAAIYIVGKAVFTNYGGGDYFDFWANLFKALFNGELSVLFLLLSPYIVWQCLRLTAAIFRKRPPPRNSDPV